MLMARSCKYQEQKDMETKTDIIKATGQKIDERAADLFTATSVIRQKLALQ